EDAVAERARDDVEVGEIGPDDLAVDAEYLDAQEAVPVVGHVRLAKTRVHPASRVGVTRPERVAERERRPRRRSRRPRPPRVEGEAAHVVGGPRGDDLVSRVEIAGVVHRLLPAQPGSVDEVEQLPERAVLDLAGRSPPEPE